MSSKFDDFLVLIAWQRLDEARLGDSFSEEILDTTFGFVSCELE